MLGQKEASVLFELEQLLRIITLTIPDLKPRQMLVDIACSGVCHSQLLEVHGKRGYDRYIPMYVDLYLSDKLNLDRITTYPCGLDDINEALENLENGRVGRAMIDMSPGV